MVSNKVLIVSRFCGRHLVASLASLIKRLNAGTRGVVGFCGRFSERVKVCLNSPHQNKVRLNAPSSSHQNKVRLNSPRQNKTRLNSRLNASHLSANKAHLNVAACLNAGKRHLALATLVVTAGVFAACAGLTAGKSQLSYSTLIIGDAVQNPKTKRIIEVRLDTIELDPYKDRRELIRQVYERCANPSAKFKEFLANGYTEIKVLYYNPKNKDTLTSIEPLKCTFSKDGQLEKIHKYFIGEFYEQYGQAFDKRYVGKDINAARAATKATGRSYQIKKGYELDKLDELVEKVANGVWDLPNELFISPYLNIVDAVLKQQNNKTAPEKKIKIILGEQSISTTTGKMSVNELDSFEFDVNKGRREFVKAAYGVCSKPSSKLKDYVSEEFKLRKETKVESVDVGLWYKTKSGLKEFKFVECSYYKIYNSVQLVEIGRVSLTQSSELEKQFNSKGNLVGSLFNIDFLTTKSTSDSTLEAIVDKVIGSIDWGIRSSFNYEFMQLVDAANTDNASDASQSKK